MAKKYDGKLVFACEDEFGPIEVVDCRAFRGLYFGNRCKQSEILRNHPQYLTLEYMQHMMAALVFYPAFSRVLILGMGGGNLGHFIHYFYPGTVIDICDIRPKVFEVAEEFFHFPVSPNVRKYALDASVFLAHNRSKYDLIFVDLFGADGLSTVLRHKVFYLNLFANLTKNGALIFNMWSSDLSPLGNVESILGKSFNVCLKLPTPKGNVIYIVLPANRKKYLLSAKPHFAELNDRSMSIPFNQIFHRLVYSNEEFFLGKKHGK